MNSTAAEIEALEDNLAEGIAALMAAEEQLAQPEDMADLFLEELNRLWAEPEPLPAFE
jgi:hypothetical protein